MKNLFFFLILTFIFNFNSNAQDSLAYKDFYAGIGVSNAGVKMYNQICKDFHFEGMGMVFPTFSAGFSKSSKKFAVEFGIDHGSNSYEHFIKPFHSANFSVTNVGLSLKYSLLNTYKSNINVLSNLRAQSVQIERDSVGDTSKLFALSSSHIEKNLIGLGLGIEYIYKGKVQKERSIIFGVRAAYNFYILDQGWEQGLTIRHMHDDGPKGDLGYFQASLFLGMRIYKKAR